MNINIPDIIGAVTREITSRDHGANLPVFWWPPAITTQARMTCGMH